MKLFIVLSALLCSLTFVGCGKYTYDDKEYGTTAFINLEELAGTTVSPGKFGVIRQHIFRDVHTGVLYTSWNYDSISPIMKADGTCLTYDEWLLLELRRNKE